MRKTLLHEAALHLDLGDLIVHSDDRRTGRHIPTIQPTRTSEGSRTTVIMPCANWPVFFALMGPEVAT